MSSSDLRLHVVGNLELSVRWGPMFFASNSSGGFRSDLSVVVFQDALSLRIQNLRLRLCTFASIGTLSAHVVGNLELREVDRPMA